MKLHLIGNTAPQWRITFKKFISESEMIKNTEWCNMLQPLLFHVSSITFHVSALCLIKGDNAECFHSRACVYPSN